MEIINENRSEENDFTLDRELFHDKFIKSYGTNADWSMNIKKFAEMMYRTIYDPKGMVQEYEVDKLPQDKFPDRPSVMESEIDFGGVTPDKEEFISDIRNIAYTLPQQEFMYDDAKETVEAIAQQHPVMVWTQGDQYGQGEYAGSFEQGSKIVSAGLEAYAGVTSEDKFSEEAVGKIKELISNNELDYVVVVEDRLKNIERLRQLLSNEGIGSLAVWVRQGRYGDMASGDSDPSIVEIPSIKDLTELSFEGKPGFVVDFDGVLADQGKRREYFADKLANYVEKIARGSVPRDEHDSVIVDEL